MTVQEFWRNYNWEPATGPMRNTIIGDEPVPDPIRHAWDAATKAEREACADLATRWRENLPDSEASAETRAIGRAIRARGDQ